MTVVQISNDCAERRVERGGLRHRVAPLPRVRHERVMKGVRAKTLRARRRPAGSRVTDRIGISSRESQPTERSRVNTSAVPFSSRRASISGKPRFARSKPMRASLTSANVSCGCVGTGCSCQSRVSRGKSSGRSMMSNGVSARKQSARRALGTRRANDDRARDSQSSSQCQSAAHRRAR